MTETARLRSRLSLDVANLKEATAVIVKEHYLHRGRTMAQMPYWIALDGERVGVLLFSYPRLSVEYQGHQPMNLVELARMWVDPSVQGKSVTDSSGLSHTLPIASCAVGMALRRIRQDWHGKYPHLPLVEACVSWADDTHHEGVIYRASNFIETGKSGGSLPGKGRKNHLDYLHSKTAFIWRWPRDLTKTQKEDAKKTWQALRSRSLFDKIDFP